MPWLLSQLPVEIVLETVTHLHISDALSLTCTCASLHALAAQRSFWIIVLGTARLKCPLFSCPPHTDLSELSLSRLKEIAFASLRLEDRWSRRRLIPKQRVKTTNFKEPVEVLSTLQGTGLLVLHLPASSRLVCWDSQCDSLELSQPPILTNGRIVGVSAPFELPGVSYLGILIMQPESPYTTERHIVSIQHANRVVTGFSSRYSLTPTPFEHYFESLFITEDTIGTILVEEAEDVCRISCCPLREIGQTCDTISEVRLPQKILNARDLTVCFAFNGHLYNLIEDGTSISIQHVSRRSIASGRCEQTNLYTVSAAAEGGSAVSRFNPFCFILPSNPAYGVGAAFIHAFEAGELSQWNDKTQVIFLPTHLTHAPDDGVHSPLGFERDCVVVEISGYPSDISHVWMDHSGLNVVLGGDGFRDSGAGEEEERVLLPVRLLLVRYSDAATTTHVLEMPEGVDLQAVTAVSVDDTMGVVHLVDHSGVFRTLIYV